MRTSTDTRFGGENGTAPLGDDVRQELAAWADSAVVDPGWSQAKTDQSAGSRYQEETGPTARRIRQLELPRLRAARAERFELLRKFEGVVLELHGDGFTARLEDQLGEIDDLEADFPIQDVLDSDRSLVVPGAVFYFSIGYRVDRGTRKRESIVRFRRLPTWSAEEIDEAGRGS